MKKMIYSFLVVACSAPALPATARNFSVKAYGDIGLGNSMSLTTALPGMTHKSSANAFGLDFGYTFWHQGGSSLEANIGLGYRMASATFDIPSLSFDYAAPASADEDGNPYIRHTSLSEISQKRSLGYFNIPIYLQYQYRITKWLGAHADIGFGLGFLCTGSTAQTTGTATSYGVYPEYDDLVIKADYLNGFGERNLADASTGKADIKGFAASVMCGAGFEFYIYDPVSLDISVRYTAGLTDLFTGHYDVTPETGYNAETAPVTYSVADGIRVKALSDYVTKSRLNPLSLHVGINVRF